MAAVGLIGCGWLSVKPVTGDATTDVGNAPGTPDAPPIPAAICGVTRIPVDTTPAVADLAIAPI